MLLWLSEYLMQYYSGFNVFQYITLRTILGALTSLFIALIIGPVLINYLGKYKVGQSVRDDGPISHLDKTGTPTMGGLLICGAILGVVLLLADLTNNYVHLALTLFIWLGALGAVDDWLKLTGGRRHPTARGSFLRGPTRLRCDLQTAERAFASSRASGTVGPASARGRPGTDPLASSEMWRTRQEARPC